MKSAFSVAVLLALALGVASSSPSAPPPQAARLERDYPVQPVPFTAVHLTDAFWAPKIKTNAEVTIPFAFGQCETSGRVDNFIRAAQALQGTLTNTRAPGYPFDDTDLYKVVEGASYALSVNRDPEARSDGGRLHREDCRGAGEGRLPLHDAHDQPGGAAPMGGPGAVGAGESRQPRALQLRPPHRGRRRALPGDGEADAARRRRALRRPPRQHVRPGQEGDLARTPDHRDGASSASTA